MKTLTVAALFWSVSFSVWAQDGNGALDSAKALYLSASYQEALTALDTVQNGAQADEAAKYRALCLLGLNRTQDAETAIEQLIRRRPLFALDPADSPKLRSLFTDARARVLPAAATSMYQSAKAAFDRGELTTAADQFAAVVTLLGQPEVASAPTLSDLKVLAVGFAKLVDQQLALQRQAAAAAAAAPPAKPADVPRPAPVAPAADPDRIYGEQDVEVVPPVPIAQSIPPWVPPSFDVRSVTFTGALDVVVDEQGAVTSVTVTHPTIATYDQLLIAAAKGWRYRPASREGHPVKYRKSIHITLRPRPTAPLPGS